MRKLPNHPWDEIVKNNPSKGDLVRDNLPENYEFSFDYALPQMWVNAFVNETGIDYCQLTGTTIWVYDEFIHGYPVSFCTETQELLTAYLNKMGYYHA